MTTWGYARISTDDQDCALQIDALVAAGVDMDNLVQEVGSGAGDLPLLQDLLGRVQTGDALVIWKIDRLSRRGASDALAVAERLRDQGVALRITTLGIDTGTSAGQLIFGILAQIAAWERDQIKERCDAGRKAAKKRVGRKPSLDDVQAVEARALVKSGRSYGAVARLLGTSKSVVWRAVQRVG